VSDALRTAMEAGLPFTGLRAFTVDPRMWLYVPHRTAVAQQVVPMTIIADRLQLACATADPDLSPIRRHFPELRIDVVIAPANEIDRVLSHAQGTDT
jgi:hypothetical protein